MNLLLDTQAFLWFVTGDARLSEKGKAAIEDGNNFRSLSIASIWEMAIKHRIGKLSLSDPFDQFILRETVLNRVAMLPITVEHAMAVAFLPLHHRDPFDRLIVVQAISEKMELVSSDVALDQYGVTRIW